MKNIGLILALIIAGVSLPIGIIGLMEKPATPTTEIYEYYYNNTIIEQYNTTIYTPTNRTMEFYHFSEIEASTVFFNETYNITSDTLIILTSTSNSSMELTITTDTWTWGESWGYRTMCWGFVATNGTYEFAYKCGSGDNIYADISVVLMW